MLKGKTPLVVALALGLLAGLVSWTAIKKRERDVRQGWELVPVVVASREIPEGALITNDMISQRAVPEQFVTSSVVKPESANYVIDQKVLVPLQAGDPLLWSQFETTKASERLSLKVQKKGRAVTISADKIASVGAWVRPNDHVDIIGTFKDPAKGEQVALTLLQDIIVLATGKITGTTNVNLIPESQREYNNVSVLVVPEEAEILMLATELGTLRMTLRNPDDRDTQEEHSHVDYKTLLSGERTTALRKQRQQTIQVIRGAASQVMPATGGNLPQ